MATAFKRCSKCGEDRDYSFFSKRKDAKDGLQAWCKLCSKAHNRAYCVGYYAENKSKVLARAKEYRISNRDKCSYSARKEYFKSRDKHLRRTSPDFCVKKNLRTRLHELLKKRVKVGSAVSDLGCSIQHLKLHLELFWDEGMSWLNYGNKPGQWSIDHIKPLASFDLTDRSQLLQAVHYTNLQPLWHVDNIAKGCVVA